jgi:hypothetical protein
MCRGWSFLIRKGCRSLGGRSISRDAWASMLAE